MFEVYAVIASVMLPLGITSMVYFIYHLKRYSGNAVLWTLVFESFATVLVGIFYTSCAIISSQSAAANEVGFVNNNIDDLAIINETAAGDIEIPTFYAHNEEASSEQYNEIEDTRNNKNKGQASDFLRLYQNLVQTSIEKRLQNATRKEKSLYQRMLKYVKNLGGGAAMETVENRDCFLKTFFYQALLVYSFVTSAFSLLNACQICQKCEEPQLEPTMKTSKSDNPSESFGERIADDASDKSSQNAAPVGPLFDTESLGRSPRPNFELFSVKNATQLEDSPSNLHQEKPTLTAMKCVTMLIVPTLLVVLLYFIMKNGVAIEGATPADKLVEFLPPNFNKTQPNAQTANFVKTFMGEQGNNSAQVEDIIRHVYVVINKFQQDREHIKVPSSATGQYLFKSNLENATKSNEHECVSNEPSLKAFDFAVFVIMFFVVIFYAKLGQAKSSTNAHINKCIVAFSALWTPVIIDLVASKLLTDRQPNIVSALLLLLGNMDRAYSAKQNVRMYKQYVKRQATVKPIKA